MSEYLIEMKDINKSFGSNEVLKNINLYIKKNEFLTLLGPSGCGKTTILRIIGGFEHPDSGDLKFDGKSILNVPPHIRRVNTVFQKYALFPHMNVAENIAFGLKIKKVDKKIIAEKVAAMLKLVNLEGYENRSVSNLSGGQQQRIAIARALVNEPEVLLLDEPLGALDQKLRKEMQIELKNMQQKIGITFISVTHDQEEALTMSDTVAVMREGRLLQVGTPKNIYDEPVNAFVADFIGESNLVDGVMIEDYRVKLCGIVFNCVDFGFKPNELVDVAVRPEDIDIYPKDKGHITGLVKNLIFRGMHYEIQILSNDFLWRVHTTDPWEVGTTVGISIDEDLIHVMRKSAPIDGGGLEYAAEVKQG